jgi:hypothetical protein
MSWHPRVAKSRKAVHKAAHKTKAGPLTKPYFIRFLGFPEFAAESPFLSANFPIEKRSPANTLAATRSSRLWHGHADLGA